MLYICESSISCGEIYSYFRVALRIEINIRYDKFIEHFLNNFKR